MKGTLFHVFAAALLSLIFVAVVSVAPHARSIHAQCCLAAPTIERTYFDGPDFYYPTTADFVQYVNVNGGDLYVVESNAAPATDSCYVLNNQGYLPVTGVSGGEWLVDRWWWGPDVLGYKLPREIAFYRQVHPTGCGFTMYQALQTQCGPLPQPFGSLLYTPPGGNLLWAEILPTVLLMVRYDISNVADGYVYH